MQNACNKVVGNENLNHGFSLINKNLYQYRRTDPICNIQLCMNDSGDACQSIVTSFVGHYRWMKRMFRLLLLNAQKKDLSC